MRKWIVLLVIVLAFGMVPAFAQTNDSPLLQMLARVPDTSSAREYLSYIDYKALLESRPGAPSVSSWQEFNTIVSSKSKEQALLMAALRGIQSGPQFFAQYIMLAENTPTVAGFDEFAIQRAIEFGTPPEIGDILEGDFDAKAVEAAHIKRDYTSSEIEDLTLLCPSAGCDTGIRTDLQNINRANPFGGQLGRSQPVLVGDKLIASSPSIAVVQSIAAAIANSSASLADQPDYHAAAEAISANGTLIQSYFIPPADLSSASSLLASSRLSPEQIKALRERLEADFVPMPAYNLIALADVATDTEEQALVALVYLNQADAEAAAKLFPDRLENYTSLATQQSMSDLLKERGVTSVDASLYTGKDRSVLVLTLHAPLPSDVVPTDGSPIQASGLVYSLLMRGYMTRDLGWLATQF